MLNYILKAAAHRKGVGSVPLLLAILFFFAGCSSQNSNKLSVSSSGITVSVNPKKGIYHIHANQLDWNFSGKVGGSLSNVRTSAGSDSIGSYKAVRFSWKADNAYEGSIRRYNDKPVVLFSLTTPQKAGHIKAQFPAFTTFPASMHHYSFGNTAFAPPEFKLTQTSTPWLFFNNDDKAFILSPASDFIVSKMSGGQDTLASGLNPKLQNLPAHFTHKTLLVISGDIHSAWQQWGGAMRALHGRKRPGNESGPILKYYGYWTDNGADYYYNFDKSKGYGGTLRAVKKQYQKEGIPMGYMQLDSWWYEKSIYGPSGKPNAGHKNREMSNQGSWNNYGGMLTYRADKHVFPHGLKQFGHSLGLPLVVHNRWIDPHSPYRKKYNITGFAAVDSSFWNHIAGFIKSAGVAVYEQDWLNVIYNHTPKMASDLSVGNAFTGDMAKAMKSHGLDMQYCMAMPRFFMQGVKYNNLTTIRTSDDRFEPTKWRHFVYVSQLAYAMGIWPWSDVFMSHETGNMILSVLSAGAVGTGDKLGNEDKANILKAARTDGVLVKPDAALLPMDSDYIHDANQANKPMLAFTYTKQNNVRTNYVVAFAPQQMGRKSYSFTPSDADLGMKGTVVVYNPLSGGLKKMNADSTFTGNLANGTDTGPMEKTGNTSGKQYKFSYYIVAPVTPIGVGFLGDAGKIAATGRQRISTLSSTKSQLTIRVQVAAGASPVRLHGYYNKPIKADQGSLKLQPGKHTFTLTVTPPANAQQAVIHIRNK